jgi:S1-C subfamily serine protease
MSRKIEPVVMWLFFSVICFIFVHSVKIFAQDISESMPADVFNKVSPATVKIICDNGQEFGTGSIVAITKGGAALILTACHVITGSDVRDERIPLEFYKDIQVKISTEPAPVRARVLPDFIDRANDLALIGTTKVISGENVISYSLGEKIKPGQRVAAFGFPGGGELHQTVGDLTSIQGNYFVFDAVIDKGSSGGSLVDRKGIMIGLTTFIQASEGYALKMDLVSPVVNGWLDGLELKKKWKLEKDTSLIKNPRFIAGGLLVSGTILYFIFKPPPDDERPDLSTPPALPKSSKK